MGIKLIQILLSCCLCFSLSAEDLQVLHNQSELEDLPLPGEIYQLRAAIRGSELIARLKAVVSIDGTASEVTSLPGVMNEQELMVYTFEIPAPDADLSYQFYANLGDSKYVTSKRYNYQRACLVDLKIPDLPPDSGSERVIYTVKKARELEHQIKLYDQILESIDRLNREIVK